MEKGNPSPDRPFTIELSMPRSVLIMLISRYPDITELSSPLPPESSLDFRAGRAPHGNDLPPAAPGASGLPGSSLPAAPPAAVFSPAAPGGGSPAAEGGSSAPCGGSLGVISTDASLADSSPAAPAAADVEKAGTENYYRAQIRRSYKLKKAIFDGILPYRSLAYCGWKAIPAISISPSGYEYTTNCPGHVVLSSSNNSKKFSYWGQQRCRNTWLCEECGPRRMYKAKHDLLTVCNGLVNDGYDIVMITFTLPHQIHDTISTGVKNISKCIRLMLSGAGSNKMRKKYDLLKVSTTKECTFLAPTKQQSTIYLHGAHYHEHAVFAVQRGIDIKELENDLIERWSQIALSQNIITSSQIDDVREHGVRASRVITLTDLASASDSEDSDSEDSENSDNSENSENSDEISIESLEKLVGYAIKGIGKYVTTSGKLSKKSGRIDSFTMRNLALGDRPEYLPILAEFMQAIQGVPMFRLSPSLRNQYVTSLKQEEKYETIYDFGERDWLLTHSSGHARNLLKVAETEGLGAFAAAANAISRGCDPMTGEELVDDKTIGKIGARLRACEDHAQADIEPRSALFTALTPAIDAFHGSESGSAGELCIFDEAADAHGAKAERKRAETAAAAEAFEIAIKEHKQFLEDSFFTVFKNTKKSRETREEKRKNAEAKRRQAISPQNQLERLICRSMQQMFLTDYDCTLEIDKMTDIQSINMNSARSVDRDLSYFGWMLTSSYCNYRLENEYNICTEDDKEEAKKSIIEEQKRRYSDRYNYTNHYKRVLSELRRHEETIRGQYVDRTYPGHAVWIRAFGAAPTVKNGHVDLLALATDPLPFLSALVADGFPARHADKIKELYIRHKINSFRRRVPCPKKINASGHRYESTLGQVLALIRAESESMARRGLPMLAHAV